MADVVVDLIPSMLGLLVTPAAIAGAILLLSTARPRTPEGHDSHAT